MPEVTRDGIARFTLTFVLAGLVGYGACGDGDDQAKSVDSPSTNDADQARTTPGSGAEATGVSDEQQLTAGELKGLLLAPEDMPAGWTIAGEDMNEGDESFCGTGLDSRVPPDGEAGVTLKQSGSGQYLGEGLSSYAVDEAETAFGAFSDAVASCTTWTETDARGTPINYQLEPLSIPSLGNETVAFRVTSDPVMGVSVHMDAVFVRRGGLILAVAHLIFGSERTDIEQTEQFVRLAYDKID